MVAAPTTSLPERVGGPRNWDYRFCWVRDSAFTMAAFLGLGCGADARAYFWWLMQASQLTHPRLRVLYRLDGGPHAPERDLPLHGYLGSSPVRVGNAAAAQLQLDTYGELLQTAWLYATSGYRIDADIAQRLAEIADLVSRIWRQPDAGIWEVRSQPEHFTQSKMMCWVALDRARDLAERGLIPAGHAERWRREAQAIEEFVETRCFSQEKQSYVRHPGARGLDASLLLGVLASYGDPTTGRWAGTIEAIRCELGDGPFVRRYSGEDGLEGSEGAFLTCSFWLAEALARSGRVEDAVELMDRLVGLANDVGLYAEEIEPTSGAFLGNFPQGLTHFVGQCGAGRFRGERAVSVWGALAGGFVGTLVLTTALRAGNGLNLTRIDLPFLLGTAFTSNRTRAKALGYVLHFVVGLAFAPAWLPDAELRHPNAARRPRRPHCLRDARRGLVLAGQLSGVSAGRCLAPS